MARSATQIADVDLATGEVVEVELFVAVLGAPNFTYMQKQAKRGTCRIG